MFPLRALVVVAVLAFAQADVKSELEESFTIFLDLDNYHVGKDGNHEFLTHEHIGEHDNIIVQMSEEEMRLHMDKHETHDCDHPADQHEIVSFIQEAMWERPVLSSPNFIDDAINQNYNMGGNAWSTQMGGNALMPQMGTPFAMMGLPQQQNPVDNALVQMSKTVPSVAAPAAAPVAKVEAAPVAKVEAAPVAKVEAAPVAKVEAAPVTKMEAAPVTKMEAAPVTKIEAKSSAEVDVEEEAAVARFRDAYHAYKYSGDDADKNEAANTAGLFDKVFNEGDKKAMGLFSGERKDVPADAFHEDNFAVDGVLDKIVDEALGEKDNEHKHKHHHSKSANVEEVAAAAPAASSNLIFSDDEKAALKKLVSKLTSSDDQTKLELEKELGSGVVDAVAPAPAKKEEAAPAPLVGSDVDATKPSSVNMVQALTEKGKSVIEEEEEQAILAMPTAPTGGEFSDKSHISKLPNKADYIPESVYAQESVSFDEPKNMQAKHMPKRILIPRMEEPGPVIGGGSRPVHIMLPPADDSFMKGSSRPAAPVGVQAQIRAAFGPSVPSSITNAAEQAQPPSNKVTTLASANDEALTAAEVVIF